jgi:hypothetical protein
MKATKAQGRPPSSQNSEDCETTVPGRVLEIQINTDGLVDGEPASQNMMDNFESLAVSEENAKSGVTKKANNESENVPVIAGVVNVTQTQHDQRASFEPPNNAELKEADVIM